MLTILHPEIIQELKDFYAGLWPRSFPDGSMVLIIKASKESILAAKLMKGIRFYFVPSSVDDYRFSGIITTFPDDEDEPLVVTSSLFQGDSFTEEIIALFSRESFDVHLFDENNRELLGYRATNPDFQRFEALAKDASFSPLSLQNAKVLLEQMDRWFGERTVFHDNDAFNIDFGEPLFPEDLFIMDLSEDAVGFQSDNIPVHATLERETAGAMQELDIVRLLQRVFQSEEIFLNPFRTDRPNLEFVDVMVVTERNIFLVQAKDSPNVEAMVRRNITRKRSVAKSQLSKAVKQLRGAIKYARGKEPMTVTIGRNIHSISLSDKAIVGLVVLKEMFDPDAAAYAGPTLSLAENAQVLCIAMDYVQLHACTLNLTNEDSFLRGCSAIFKGGLENGVFPRLRFGLVKNASPAN